MHKMSHEIYSIVCFICSTFVNNNNIHLTTIHLVLIFPQMQNNTVTLQTLYVNFGILISHIRSIC